MMWWRSVSTLQQYNSMFWNGELAVIRGGEGEGRGNGARARACLCVCLCVCV